MRRPGTELATTLAPSERGWWTAGAVAFHKTAANTANAMAWTRGRLLFENVPLARAVAEEKRYSKDVRIELADTRLARSEELRVGQECVITRRTRWSQCHYKTKTTYQTR